MGSVGKWEIGKWKAEGAERERLKVGKRGSDRRCGRCLNCCRPWIKPEGLEQPAPISGNGRGREEAGAVFEPR